MRSSYAQPKTCRSRPLQKFRSSAAAFLLVLQLCGVPAQAHQANQSPESQQSPQQQDRPTLPISDLATENLSHVAASADQIEAVLRKEPGLLVELKRYVAKEATESAQIVDDTLLTEQGIFDRLARDPSFRAVATRLLQRYGYLIPKPNPGSEAALEQELLFQERQLRLRKALAEVEKPMETGKETRSEQRTSRSSGVPQRGEPASPPALPKSLPDDVNLPSRSLVRTGGESQPGATQRAADLLLTSSKDEDRSALDGQLRERGQITPAAPESGNSPPTGVGPNAPHGESQLELPPSDHKKIKEEVSKEEVGIDPWGMVRRPNPYANIPSLYDMYMQVSTHEPTLKEFGLEVFRPDRSASGLLPMDLPVGPDYVVGPGDGLEIDLWGAVSQRLYRIVDREGRVALPEAGPLLVSGRTMGQVQQAVQRVLRTQFRDVSADVSLSRLRTIRVYVVGDVERPGAYDISSLSTPLNALLAAGGPTLRGSLRAVKHYRGRQLVQDVDLYDLLLRGVRSDLIRLETGDSLLIPPMGPKVTVEGMVRRPAIYELHGEKTLADVLDLAGGILPTATFRHMEVQRVEAHQKRTMLSLDIGEGTEASAINRRLESFAVQNDDEVRIFPIAPFNQDAVYLQGHVLRPGRYSYRPGMRLTDLISSYADLLPEPASRYAEIIRLHPPDYRPAVESFNLSAVLANPATAPKLEPLDTVRIFGRYDFENLPIVTVTGAVRQPGSYQSPGQIHLGDAIQLAGGLRPDARMEDAQVFSYLPDGQLKVTSVNLQRALAGDPLDNILLQPRDRIVVHRNLAQADAPSVFIKGEVARPGRYPLTANMRVGNLIRLGGGLKRSADTETADLTQYLAEDSKTQLGAQHEIKINAALAGEPDQNLPLRDGDTLTIRQIPGWNDIGAYVVVRGEVRHPGTYGIRPGERLSSVLMRAGGFLPTAYPQGAVFEREEVRSFQTKSKQELIQRIQQEAGSFKASLQQNAQEQVALQQAALQQRQRTIEALQQASASGRLVLRLRDNLAEFRNSPDDIELRTGDTLFVPKRPNFVLVTGQVYNSNAVTYLPRRNAEWYLKQAGGPTNLAEKKAIFIIRASGSVVSGKGGGWWSGSVLSTQIQPGDTIVIPEKPVGGSPAWKNLLSVAQIAQAGALTAFLATR